MAKEKFDRSKPHVNINTIGGSMKKGTVIALAAMQELYDFNNVKVDSNMNKEEKKEKKNKLSLTKEEVEAMSKMNKKEKKRFLKERK